MACLAINESGAISFEIRGKGTLRRGYPGGLVRGNLCLRFAPYFTSTSRRKSRRTADPVKSGDGVRGFRGSRCWHGATAGSASPRQRPLGASVESLRRRIFLPCKDSCWPAPFRWTWRAKQHQKRCIRLEASDPPVSIFRPSDLSVCTVDRDQQIMDLSDGGSQPRGGEVSAIVLR